MTDESYLSTEDAKALYKALQSIKTDEECKDFLRDLLTEQEIKEYINRWKAVRMLDMKVPYEDITKITGMSSTTVARISKWLQKGTGGYSLILRRIRKKLK
jgi:TrpR-related protein YerC/YecD